MIKTNIYFYYKPIHRGCKLKPSKYLHLWIIHYVAEISLSVVYFAKQTLCTFNQ